MPLKKKKAAGKKPGGKKTPAKRTVKKADVVEDPPSLSQVLNDDLRLAPGQTAVVVLEGGVTFTARDLRFRAVSYSLVAIGGEEDTGKALVLLWTNVKHVIKNPAPQAAGDEPTEDVPESPEGGGPDW